MYQACLYQFCAGILHFTYWFVVSLFVKLIGRIIPKITCILIQISLSCHYWQFSPPTFFVGVCSLTSHALCKTMLKAEYYEIHAIYIATCLQFPLLLIHFYHTCLLMKEAISATAVLEIYGVPESSCCYSVLMFLDKMLNLSIVSLPVDTWTWDLPNVK